MLVQQRIRQGRNGLPVAPVEVQDAVELYAREYDRTATVHFIPTCGWMARFSLRVNDPMMQLYRQGQAAEPPTEDVWFHEPHPRGGQPNGQGGRYPDYVPLDLYQLGAAGVRQFLEKGNTWSGRGVHSSIEAAVSGAHQKDLATAEQFRAKTKEDNKLEQREKRRWWLKIPFLPVGISLAGTSPTKESTP